MQTVITWYLKCKLFIVCYTYTCSHIIYYNGFNMFEYVIQADLENIFKAYIEDSLI